MSWSLTPAPGDCSHAQAQAGPPGLYGAAMIWCPDCKTWLAETPADSARIAAELARPGAIAFNVAQPEPIDWHGWRIATAPQPAQPIKIGVTELRAAVLKASGVNLPVETCDASSAPAKRTILIGEAGTHALLERLGAAGRLRSQAADARRDAFAITHLRGQKADGGELLALQGSNARASLYACLELAGRIERGEALTGIALEEEATFELRGGYCEGAWEAVLPEITISGYTTNFAELLGLAKRRANLLILRESCWDNRLIRWSGLREVSFEHMPSDVRESLEQEQAQYAHDLKLAKQFGMVVLFHTCVLHPSWADGQLFAAAPELRATTDPSRVAPPYGALRRYNPGHPLFNRMLTAEVDEAFERYPELDGLYSWHGYDGAPLVDDAESNATTSFSQRLIDAHRVRHDAMLLHRPQGYYIVDHAGMNHVSRRLQAELPPTVIFSNWDRPSRQHLAPHAPLSDPHRLKGRRTFGQVSSHAEGLVCGVLPVFDLEHLRDDILQYAAPRAMGIGDHHPFLAAALGSPEKYFDIAEPYHEAALAWAWDPLAGSGAELLRRWAGRRFGAPAAEAIAEAYEHLAQLKRITLYPEVLLKGFSYSPVPPFDWALLDPEAKIEGRYLRVYDQPREGIEAPHPFNERGTPHYIWDDALRTTPITPDTLATWLARFDGRAPVAAALAALDRAEAAAPDARHLPQLRLLVEGIAVSCDLFLLWAEAGLRWRCLEALPASEQTAQRTVIESLLEAALDCAWRQLTMPSSAALNWLRWGQRFFREDSLRVVQRKLADWQAKFGRTFDQPGLASRSFCTAETLPRTASPRGRMEPVSFGTYPLQSATQPLDDAPEGYYLDPHVAPDRVRPSYTAMPRGPQRFADIPFALPEHGGYLRVEGTLDFAIPAVAGESSQARALHLLVSTFGREDPFCDVARVEIVRLGGSTETLPLRFRMEVTHHLFPEQAPAACVAWVAHDPQEKLYHQHRVIGFNLCTLDLGDAASPVERIRIVPAGSRATLLLFGLTLELAP